MKVHVFMVKSDGGRQQHKKGIAQIQRPLHCHKPDRSVLEVPKELGASPHEASGLCPGIRPPHHGRQGREDLRSNRPVRQWPSKPKTRNAAVRSDSTGATLDHIRTQHGDQAKRRAYIYKWQDHRWTRSQRTHNRRCWVYFAVREEYHHPWPSNPWHQSWKWWNDKRLGEPLRLPLEKRWRRYFNLWILTHLDWSRLHVELRWWADRCCWGFHSHNHLQLPFHQPQWGSIRNNFVLNLNCGNLIGNPDGNENAIVSIVFMVAIEKEKRFPSVI